MNNIPPEKLQQLLNAAGQRLGRDPNQLKSQLESGRLDNLGLDSSQQQQIGQLLKNPQAMTEFFNQPQIKRMVEQLMKGR